MHAPDRFRCWTPVRRWAWPLWSAGAPVPTAAAPAPLWGSCDTGGRSVGTGLGWCIPCGPLRPCAWHQCPANWWCRPGRSGSWALCPAPPTPLRGSYLQHKFSFIMLQYSSYIQQIDSEVMWPLYWEVRVLNLIFTCLHLFVFWEHFEA